MNKIMTTYSMLGVSSVLDGLPVVGLFDGDDAITVAPRKDEGDWLIGADGSAIFSQSADNSVTITIKLQHNSPTHRQLLNKASQQNSGVMNPFPFSVVDKNGGEASHSGHCLVSKSADISHGENATAREWTLVSPTWSAG